MYEAFFQLGARPFAAVPQTDRYFAAGAIENARKTVSRCVQRAEGVALVIGRSGTGKSLLCQVLARELDGPFVTALLASGGLCTRRALLQAILFELGLPYRGIDEGELRLMLMDYLTPENPQHEALVLIVDEAHTLPSRLFEELRMISNLIRDGRARVRLVLAGGPQLEERFASPKLDSFSQRVAARCYLEPLGREETVAYVRAQIKAVGGQPDRIFDAEALAAVHRASDGVPRLINQLCDHALLLACTGGSTRVSAVVIEEAWADLQQLPAPFTPAGDGQRQIVEFGGLDEPAEELPEAIPFHSGRGMTGLGPAENLDRIQQQLSQLEDDFQPAGSIGPEIELVFHDTGNPFSEVFAEEEVVLDRYASLDDKIFSKRPTVSSREGRELSALLAAHTRAPAEGLSHAASHETGSNPAGQSSGTQATIVQSASAQSSGTAAGRVEAGTILGSDDDDLIVVEDDPPAASRPAAPSSPADALVRRQDYRQLFAKLRRG